MKEVPIVTVKERENIECGYVKYIPYSFPMPIACFVPR